MKLVLLLGATSLLAAACQTTGPHPSAPSAAAPSTEDAAGGVSDPLLAELLRRHWASVLDRDPRYATRLGDHRYDDRLEDNSLAGITASRAANAAFLAEAVALEKQAGRSTGDATTLTLFIELLRGQVDSAICRYEEWNVSPRDNPLTDWNYLPELQPVQTPAEGQRLLARYRAIPRSIDNQIEHLRRGAKQGLYGNAETTRRTIAQFKSQLDQALEAWPLLAPAGAEHADWPLDQLTTFRGDLRAAVADGIKPAFARYLAALEAEILPHARSDEQAGLSALPLGAACYAAEVRGYTTLALDAEALHQTGLTEIARIDGELRALGAKLFGKQDLPSTLSHLRTDRSLYFTNEAEIEAKAAGALASAKAKLDGFFGIKPRADCAVLRIPDYEAPFTTIAYYREAVPDGSRPGQYFVNVYRPETRPRYEAEALAFHESIPGHHLQIAIAQELPSFPAFRRHTGQTAFVEGWGLYAEGLSDEMGLYGGDLDRIGRHSYDAWRAARLVVDTGLHAKGWSRAQAIAFMSAHTALAANNIDNEVDRYLTTPGQALAYKMGALEILRLRRWAEAELGAGFDLRAFHDAILSGGAVSLPVLGAEVRAHVAAARKR